MEIELPYKEVIIFQICFSTNNKHIKYSYKLVIARTHKFDFVLSSLEKTINYIFEYGSY